MALQQPTNITPSAFAGVGGAVFDATAGLNVSWQVNGSPYMLAYRIVIQADDNASTQLYTTGKVTLSAPFYGVKANGDVAFFAASPIPASALANASIANGGTYKMVITQWWGETDAESVTQTSASVIEACSPPTLAINTVPDPLRARLYTFTATYNQAEGDQIEWVRWQFSDVSSGNKLLGDTGNIYGTSELAYTYDGMFTGNIYAVRAQVGTQKGQTADSGWVNVYPSYPISSPTGDLVAVQKCGWNGVNISWPSARSTIGNASGAYAITDGVLALETGASVTWDAVNESPLLFAAPYSIVWSGNPKDAANKTPLFSLATTTQELSLSMTSGGSGLTAVLTADGETVATLPLSGDGIAANAGWTFILTPEKLYAQYSNISISTWNTGVTLAQSAIETVRMSGKQQCDYLWIEKGTLPEETITAILSANSYAPVWNENTYFMATFEDGLNAGNLDTTGYSLYRLDVATNEYTHLIDLAVSQTGAIDYSAKNNHEYSYQLWYTDATTYTRSPMVSNTITPCRWNDILIAAKADETGAYHPQQVFAFGCNVETSEEKNNNSPSVQKNFTRYPNWMPETTQYRTGTLKALIGKVDSTSNLYTDTAALADEIMELSNTDYVLFLRDRKGNLRQIRPSGPVGMKIEDKWPNQAVTMNFPWVEVGTMDGVSVVMTDADPLWPYDEILDTTVYIDVATGELVWVHGDEYLARNRGSVLDIDVGGKLIQEFTSTETAMADMYITQRNMLIAEQ